MKNFDDKQAALEQLIDRTLRAQPLLRAPASLEARVLAQLERLNRRPWWQRSFLEWPLPARVIFMATCTGCLWILVNSPAMQIFDGLASIMSGFRSAANIVASIAEIGRYVVEGIPSVWLYVAAIAGVATYVTFFGLGAAAYKVLYK